MPQLDFSTFPPQLVWLAISFIVLYFLMAKLGLPKVGAVIEQRRGQIEGDLEKAGRMKAEAEAVIAAYERSLADARAQAQATIKETVERLGAEAAERQREISVKLAQETAAAERRIAEAKNAALANVREIAAELARAAAIKLIGGEVPEARAVAAVDAVLKERG